MRRRIETPQIILLGFPLENIKSELQTNVEIARELDCPRGPEIEEEGTQTLCKKVID
jgi:chaperonin GroEL (HSP60 family)